MLVPDPQCRQAPSPASHHASTGTLDGLARSDDDRAACLTLTGRREPSDIRRCLQKARGRYLGLNRHALLAVDWPADLALPR